MAGRLVLVYHDPGDPRGVDMMEAMASRLSKRLGLEAVAVPMSDVEEGRHGFRKGDLVVALLPARGGHLATVLEEAEKSGARAVGPIPASVLAEGLSRALEGCREILMVYWPAKRFREEQEEDLRAIASSLENSLDAKVALVPREEFRCGECMASTTLLPGRVTKRIEGCGATRAVGYLLEASESLIEEWIAGLAEKFLVERAGSPERARG